ncbi:MAG: hypothetical protein CW338_06025 [Clostridiales bacterium]|nr:hypothetical protein [Clostridiales bacterium]
MRENLVFLLLFPAKHLLFLKTRNENFAFLMKQIVYPLRFVIYCMQKEKTEENQKSMKKARVYIILALLMMSIVLSVCLADTVTLPVHVQGALFGGSSTDMIPLTLEFDPGWLTDEGSGGFDRRLARASALLCADSYFREKDIARGTPNRVLIDGKSTDDYDFTLLLRELGFTDTEHIESYSAGEYAYDTNDSVTMNMGYMDLDGRYDVFVIVIRGCFSAGEWVSIFDPGFAGEEYAAYTGEHPEWTDTDILKGADIASNRALGFIREYIAAHDDPVRENRVLVTGHSRGGIIAQIIGAAMEDDPAVISCTYAFNTPPVTDNAGAEEYSTVFSIFDTTDFFSNCLPFGSEPMYRYGKTYTMSIPGNMLALGEAEKLNGRAYSSLTEEEQAEYIRMFGARFPDRKSLYEQRVITEVFDSAEAAEARLAECAGIIDPAGLGLDMFCRAGMTENDDGTYAVEIRYCDAALLISEGRVLAYGAAAADAVKSLFAADAGMCGIVDFIMEHGARITAGHIILNSYVITQYDLGGD